MMAKREQNVLELYNKAKSMQMENSSKIYPKICTPNNKICESLEVQIYGEPTTITSKHFFELTQIVNLSTLPSLKSSAISHVVYNENHLLMLHIFIYYCIKVEYRIELEGLDQFYLRQMGNLYVDTGFNIQIGRFARMCEMCLGIQVRKCAHIIYYLVYGRLASNSYINNIVSQVLPRTNKRQKTKPAVSSKLLAKKDNLSKKLKQSRVGSEKDQHSVYEELVDDLNKIFHGDPLQRESKPKGEQPGCQNSDQINEKEKEVVTQGQISQRNYYMNFFPNRVFNEEKSAIFESIYPGTKSHYKLMRKKKFNDDKIQKMFCMTFSMSSQNFPKDESTSQKPSISKERNKIFTHNAIRTNEKFKNTSNQLDKIRSAITKSKRRTNVLISPNTNAANISQSQRQYFQFMEKSKVESNQVGHRHQPNEIIRSEFENENTVVSLVRKQTKYQQKARRNHEGNEQEGGADEKTVLKNIENVGQNNKSNRIFHSECQSRLFKYKNEYRKFMKVHLFRNEDQP